MRTCLSGLGLVASLTLLTACGGGGSSSPGPSPNPPPPNVAPVANAGPNQTVNTGSPVTLNGTGSTDSDGTVATYTWTQTAGTAVTLSSATTSQPTFTAPAAASTLTFSLTVTDNQGAASTTASTVTITVNGGAAGTVTGRINFVRIPFSASLNVGLDYTNPQNRPARAVTVNAVDGTTSAVLASAVTNASGDYSLSVAANTSIKIQVVAQMVKTGSPSWNFTVANLDVTTTPYNYTEPTAFNSSAGAAHDVLIPSGLSTNPLGTATGTRASAPFAILDTFYQGYQLVLSAAPNTNFPALIADWAENNTTAEGTFFTSAAPQHIVLTADLTDDTDEFDQHVIAHEFGHYIEHNFSRADNIGGAHGLGDKLDPRVSFGEGFGYAFGAMVLNDPITRDSFVDSRCPNSQCSSTFNVETNPVTTPPGVNSNYGCWCSESSVWSILWDVYDPTQDANDTLNLGFSGIWGVLTNEQKNTPAYTTIFSFITALKIQSSSNANVVNAINTLVAAQNINSANIDAYGSNENNFPADTIPMVAALPIYTTMTAGGPQATLRTVNDGGPGAAGDSGNKLGNHRFIRYTSNGGNKLFTATSTNPNNHDVDFEVYRLRPPFTLEGSASNPPAVNETLNLATAASEYLVDVYDCANGCEPTEGTPGDYDLTVTITP